MSNQHSMESSARDEAQGNRSGDEQRVLMEARELRSGYGSTLVVRDVSLRIVAGQASALIGANGAGKSTFLKTMSGLLRATSGHVLLGGEDATSWPVERRAQRGLCHVPEGRAIYRSLTVRENLIMQAPRKQSDQAIERATTVFPRLSGRLSQVAGTMSGGEQQMLALAAAYVRSPSVILIDEASLGLAPIIVEQVFEYLSSLQQQAVGMLIVDQYATHALRLASHAYVMRRGAIVYDGSPEALLDSDAFETYIGRGVG